MLESIFKVHDLRSLKDFCDLLVIPLFIASFSAQLGSEIYKIPINLASSFFIKFILMFILFLVISFIAYFICIPSIIVIAYLNNLPIISGKIYPIISNLLIAFGFLGFAAKSNLSVYSSIHPLWFLTAFAFGIYFNSLNEKNSIISK